MTGITPSPQRLRDLALLRRVRDRIDREHAKPLDVEALARGVSMSAGHLSRQFRLAYCESTYTYLMTRRIEQAMTLLRRGDLSVLEVCLAVGCSSLGTFSTRFTELVGVPTPSTRKAVFSDDQLPSFATAAESVIAVGYAPVYGLKGECGSRPIRRLCGNG